MAAANGNAPGQGRVLEGVGEQADHHLAQQGRVAIGGEVGLDLDAELDVRAAPPTASTTSRIDGGDVDHLVLPRPDRLDPGQGQQRPGEAVHPLGVLGEAAEEVVERVGVVLGALLQDLDRAGDAGERVAQLVGGVGDEVGFGQLAAHLVGAVAGDDEDGALVGQGTGAHRVGAVADPQRRVGGEADVGGPLQVSPHRLRWVAVVVEQLAGGAVGEAQGTVVVDDDDGVGEAVEDRFQLVAVGGEDAEALLQRGAHRVQRAGEVADLVAAAALQRRVEGAGGHLAGGAREAGDAVGDADRDQEADEDAEGDRAEHGPGPIAEGVDDAGRDEGHRGEGSGQPEAHADPRHRGSDTVLIPIPFMSFY